MRSISAAIAFRFVVELSIIKESFERQFMHHYWRIILILLAIALLAGVVWLAKIQTAEEDRLAPAQTAEEVPSF